MTRVTNNPSAQRIERQPLRAGQWWAALAGIILCLVLGLAIDARAQDLSQQPAPLPFPLPVNEWLSKLGSQYQPKAIPVRQGYQGPPPSIDGPVFPDSGILPGITASPSSTPEVIDAPPDIVLPLGDELDGSGLPYYEDSVTGPVLDAEAYYIPGQHLSDYRDGFFQRLSLSAGWIGTGNDPGELGLTEIDSFLMVALPAPIVEWPVLISPTFNTRLFNGPPGSDIPAHVFEAYLDVTWLPLIVNRWRLLINATPGVFSDFNNTESGSFRVNGKAVAIYDWTPGQLQVVGGVLYLNRQGLPILPAAGVIWTPQPWLRMELIFPKPKIAARLNCGTGFEDWVYVMAEYGGNSWAVERSTGLADFMTYSDYRVVGGYERRLNGGAGYRLEGGYAFGRELRFRSGIGDYDPKSELFLRGGITF